MCSVTVLLGSFLFPINGSAKTRVGSYYHNLNTELKYSNLSAKVSSLSSSNAQQDVSNLNKSEKINNYLNNIKKRGYTNDQDAVTPYNYRATSSVDPSISTDVVYNVYKNNDKNTTILTQTVVDKSNNKVVSFSAEQGTTKSTSPKTEFSASNNELNQINILAKKKTKHFKFHGKEFSCGMAGVLACGSYCAVWAAVNGIAGLACAVVCGAASEGACAMNH
ncbi:hypothetical protein L3V66_12400 [Secundilactobacillus sp. HBUAS58055]|nr:putative immunity/bacteriocin fusion bifunctional protein [Secundilactobacillus angelensis]MCH5463524.1 hypothetical protein [Secundilactobacillus angelensis]